MDPRIPEIVTWFNRIYLGGVPQLIRDETAFLSFVCMLAGTEALGGYLDPDSSGPGANGDRFKQFIREYFPEDYHLLAGQLWDFRNGMAHGFSPRQFALTHHNSGAHLQQTPDSATVLNAEDFYAAFLAAARSYFTALSSSSELQARFSKRLDSRSGGGFGVGFVDRVESASF
jgi:hypothetical protein